MSGIVEPEIKICGLSTAEAVKAALDGGASHIGFIFFAKSPRHVEPEAVAKLRQMVAGKAKSVAVTVNADNAMLDDIVARVKPDMLQLHGSESPQRVAEIKARYGLAIIKAFAIRDAADLAKTIAYEEVADHYLLDAKPPAGSDLPGGNGVSFDWSLLREFKSGKPVMLSGGLDRTNIADAIAIAGPDGIDISSGVETSPGVKDTALIIAFLDQVNRLTWPISA